MKFSYLAIITLLVLSACAPEQVQDESSPVQTFECPDGTIVTDLSECQSTTQDQEEEVFEESVEDESESPFVSDEQATSRIPAELTEMRTRSEEKTGGVYSFQYMHTREGTSVNPLIDHSRVYVGENQVLYRLVEDSEINDQRVTHILVENGVAMAYCVECRDAPEPFAVEVPEIRFALEWLAAIENAEFLGAQTIDNRDAYRISGVAFGEDIEMYVDSFSGVPLRIDISSAERILYEDISLSVRSGTFDIQ